MRPTLFLVAVVVASIMVVNANDEPATEQENEGGYDTRLTDDIGSGYTDDNATDASRNASRGDGVGDREDERRIDLGEFPRGPDGPSNAGFLGFKVAYAGTGDSNSSLDRYEGAVFRWNSTIGADNYIIETAYVGVGYISVASFFPDLENSTFVGYKVIYDFTGNVSFAVVGADKESSPCLLFNISLSFDEAVEQLKRINDTQLETSNQESYIASSTPLTEEERNEIRQSSRVVADTCSDTEMVITKVTDFWYGPPDVSLMILNDVVDIYYEETVSKRTEERRGGRSGQSGSDRGGTDISGSDRGGTDISGSDRGGTEISGSDRGGTDISGSDRGGTDISGSDIGGTDISGSDIGGTDISDSDIGGTDISGSDIGGTDIIGSDRVGTDISGSDRGGTDISGSDRGGTDISGSDRDGTDISGSDRDGTDISGSDRGGTNISGSDGGGTDISGSDGGGTDISGNDRGDGRRPSLRHYKDCDSDESNESKHHSRKHHKDRKSKESKHRSGRRHKRKDSESNESNESRD